MYQKLFSQIVKFKFTVPYLFNSIVYDEFSSINGLFVDLQVRISVMLLCLILFSKLRKLSTAINYRSCTKFFHWKKFLYSPLEYLSFNFIKICVIYFYIWEKLNVIFRRYKIFCKLRNWIKYFLNFALILAIENLRNNCFLRQNYWIFCKCTNLQICSLFLR